MTECKIRNCIEDAEANGYCSGHSGEMEENKKIYGEENEKTK